MEVDRRVRRTRESIRSALLSQMRHTPYQDLTVSAICREADIGRGTFYAHYSDAFEVVQEMEREFFAKIRAIAFDYFDDSTPQRATKLVRSLLQLCRENKDAFEVLYGDPGSEFLPRLQKHCFELFYYHNIKYYAPKNTTIEQYRVKGLFEMVMTIIRRWFADDFSQSEDTVSEAIGNWIQGVSR